MENAVTQRNIKYLWHFTQLKNVNSILQDGIVPRASLEASESNAAYNDQYRLDGFKNASCLSISHPNYKMFYSLRQKDLSVDWAVFAIKSEVLWTKDCAFCTTNAASSLVTSTPLTQRKGVSAFESLFLPVAGKPSRQDLQLPSEFPTDPQAEVLVFDTILPNDIVGVVLQSEAKVQELKPLYPSHHVVYHGNYFSARLDYQHW
ncbi:DUF4433 domain-containing protein [Vibrio harveyi]|uniref:DarT ssDNA thymidine ADP-ribosyltransferase family protein n=1 Tax=Vibrio harveyi TaxID=669 RepID=UPI003BB54A00